MYNYIYGSHNCINGNTRIILSVIKQYSAVNTVIIHMSVLRALFREEHKEIHSFDIHLRNHSTKKLKVNMKGDLTQCDNWRGIIILYKQM